MTEHICHWMQFTKHKSECLDIKGIVGEEELKI